MAQESVVGDCQGAGRAEGFLLDFSVNTEVATTTTDVYVVNCSRM
jgi:hypothetical protein